MLTHVHVKNIALIDEAEVDFGPGLNILTGETGAGKSILIDSVGVALGKKVSRDMIREGEDTALAELVFQIHDPAIEKLLSEMDAKAEDGQVILSRKISAGRSICKINGEISTAARLRQVAEALLDIHGQHEHQSLLYKNRQLDYLDDYGRAKIGPALEQTAACFREYRACSRELEEYSMDEEQRKREIDFLEYELNEIEAVALRPGEDEELEASYRRMSNSQRITATLNEIYEMTDGDSDMSAGTILGRAAQSIQGIVSCDDALRQLADTLADLDGMLGDFNRELSGYLSELTFSEEEFYSVSERLDQINHIKSKYGNSVEKIQEYAAIKQQELDRLNHYEACRREQEAKLSALEKRLSSLCEKLSGLRKTCAKQFEKKLTEHLKDLNFADVRFHIQFEETEHFSEKGKDSIEFQIAANPGEPVRPLAAVASGGELSRIMLAIRTLLAEQDHTETLIFDEIDTGISGRTAQKVSEKMALIAAHCQVICITHLPQIASMADSHFEIRKAVEKGVTHTGVFSLSEKGACEELARMLGGAEITDRVLENAVEMRKLARQFKNRI